MDAENEIILEFYKSHENSMLNHESQRANMTNIILTICTILIAVIGSMEVGIEKIILSSMLPILGIFGYVFSMKHYERFSWHLSCSNLYREKIHKEFPNTIIDRKTAREKLSLRFGWVHYITLSIIQFIQQ